MNLSRRNLLGLTAGSAAILELSRTAQGQTYPARPVRWVVGFAPGGGNDIVARVMGHWLSEQFKQSFIIENRPGAGTNVATEAVVNASPDGYTLLLVSPTAAINATLYDKLNFNFMRDIAPVAGLVGGPIIMAVNPSVPAKTVPEFIAYAKANPGKVNMASAGIGSGGHLAGELFKMMTAINLVHVPYRGNAPALQALLGGQVQVQFPTSASVLEYIKSGQLRALAVTTTTRLNELPDVPTVAEFVPGYEANQWYGVGAPKRTPVEVIDIIGKAVAAGLADPGMKARFADLGDIPMPMAPDQFGKFIADETEKWAKVIRAGNIKAE
jgi:tripartite-type tricarboxylate transporter receptor subunit TctC